ncbi:MAG: ABC transporter ATP-binding protein [Opitutaceae bacterium]
MSKEFPVLLRGVRLRAVDRLSLEVAEGQIYGLLGPNGSGKSTTIKILLGLLPPTAGTCEVFGGAPSKIETRAQVGYLPEAPDYHRFLTGRELVDLHARLSGVAARRRRDRTAEVIAWVGLEDAADRRVGTYSKGMLQRIGLAQALVHDPRLLILDEPTAGVDPLGTAEIARLIQKLRAAGKTILLSSHLLAQVEGICDRVAILHRGRLIFESAVAGLAAGSNADALLVENLLPQDVEALRAWLEQRGARLLRVEKPRVNLDRVFLERVGSATNEPAVGQAEDR